MLRIRDPGLDPGIPGICRILDPGIPDAGSQIPGSRILGSRMPDPGILGSWDPRSGIPDPGRCHIELQRSRFLNDFLYFLSSIFDAILDFLEVPAELRQELSRIEYLLKTPTRKQYFRDHIFRIVNHRSSRGRALARFRIAFNADKPTLLQRGRDAGDVVTHADVKMTLKSLVEE